MHRLACLFSRYAALASVCICSSAAASNIVGFVVTGTDATIAGKPVTAGRTVVSGETVQVGGGSLMLAVGNGGKLTLNPGTSARFQKNPTDVVALLNSGGISLDQPGKNSDWHIQTGNLSISPHSDSRTLAAVEVTSASLVVATQQGTVRVEGDIRPLDIVAGNAMRFGLSPDAAASQAPPDPQTPAAGSPSSPSTPPVERPPKWHKVVPCAFAGAALGSIPLLISEFRAASPVNSVGWVIPGGAVAAGLLCFELADRSGKQPPPPGTGNQPPASPGSSNAKPTPTLGAVLTAGN